MQSYPVAPYLSMICLNVCETFCPFAMDIRCRVFNVCSGTRAVRVWMFPGLPLLFRCFLLITLFCKGLKTLWQTLCAGLHSYFLSAAETVPGPFAFDGLGLYTF